MVIKKEKLFKRMLFIIRIAGYTKHASEKIIITRTINSVFAE